MLDNAKERPRYGMVYPTAGYVTGNPLHEPIK